ncbi:cyclic nucleotide-binding-like protein [Infundibulicybe gibba]|nr:cyclic nucleotide-binding-like protein [Infundibulicybe gibba]
MSTFDGLVNDLTRDVHRAQPKDVLQFCANWFQTRLEEQRTRTRDTLAQRSDSIARDLPSDIYVDAPLISTSGPSPVSPFSQTIAQHRPSLRASVSHSPFGTLNVPGNALLSDTHSSPLFKIDGRELPPTSPLTTSSPNPFSGFDNVTPTTLNPGDYLHPPTSAIFARRTSVSAESIAVDSTAEESTPVYPKTADQLRRIKKSIANNFIFRDLDEEQETGVLNAMQEIKVSRNTVVIRQGDVGEYFYVVESGLFHCYIRPEPLPPAWLTEGPSSSSVNPEDMFLQPGYHPEFGRKVGECNPGASFGELALMYGHPRAATVLSIEPSTLWSLDRITFRTIILTAAHRRRTMYEQFLSTVTLLSSLDAPERSKIADALVSRVYVDGEAVVSQGEMGDTFFFIEEGEAIATKTQPGDDGQVREIKVGHLKKGDYFGELSLLRLAPRAATVSAIHREEPTAPKLKVAALDAPAFTRLLGPLREIMERRAGESYGSSARASISR